MLLQLKAKVDKFTNDTVSKHYASKDVIAMLALKANYNTFTGDLSDYLYLADVDEEFIRKNYHEVLVTEAHASLEGLLAEQVKEYFEMKQKVIRERL